MHGCHIFIVLISKTVRWRSMPLLNNPICSIYYSTWSNPTYIVSTTGAILPIVSTIPSGGGKAGHVNMSGSDSSSNLSNKLILT